MVPESWQEALLRLALSAVEEEANQGRTSCASLGGLGVSLGGAPDSEDTIPSLSFSTKVMYSAPDMTLKMHKRNAAFQQAASRGHSALVEWASGAAQQGCNEFKPPSWERGPTAEKSAAGSECCLRQLDLEGLSTQRHCAVTGT